ncbi:MAG TPA: efflux RND transporter periplasmic adaptor subunit [Phenylobacterium sp.]
MLDEKTTDLADGAPAAPAASRGANRPAGEATSIESLLGEAPAHAWTRLGWPLTALLVAAGLLLGGFLLFRALQPHAARYVTASVRRGDLVVTVTATGTLAPVNQVDVGSELSGTVVKLYVDDNDIVHRGQVLAELDTSRLRDTVNQTQAALASAQANLALAQATVADTEVKAGRLHRLYVNSAGGYPARADIDVADADLARARAAQGAAQGAIGQARALLNTARTNLAKAVIRSPVDGVVLSRKVQVGQTVAASLQAPVLFTLAEDLTRMELDVDIDEADVGGVRAGQAAAFTVDAYPSREFPARLTRVGLGSQTKEGVVTYMGVLAVDNSDLSLRPGMTASADIASKRRTNVLLVPDAALRFTPPANGGERGIGSALMPRMPRLGTGPTRRSNDASRQQLWTLKDGRPAALQVHVGASDGRETEVSGPDLRAGLAVITQTQGAVP